LPQLQNLKNNSFRLTFLGKPLAVREALAQMMEQLTALDLSSTDLGNVELVLAEAMNNIVEHAYINTPDGTVELHVMPTRNELVCHLRDEGVPMPEGKAPNGTPAALDCNTEELPEGGFGWFLIRDLAHDLNYTRISDKNLLSFRIPVGTMQLQ